MRFLIAAFALVLACLNLEAQHGKNFAILSPDGKIIVNIETGDHFRWSIRKEADLILQPSDIGMTLEDGELLGDHPSIISTRTQSIRQDFASPFYKKKSIHDQYNSLLISCKQNYGLELRVYNDGAAYRFISTRKDSLVVQSEQANFNFGTDDTLLIPHASDLRDGERYSCSFEEFYADIPISRFNKDTLGYLPLLVKLPHGRKAVILEADLQDYPGMFVQRDVSREGAIRGTFAPYPLEERLSKHSKLDFMVTRRAGYIARCRGQRSFPWRVMVISDQDRELLDNDMVQKLSEPSRLKETDWILPGKVAWDWWNDWNITHVDFPAGINTRTYKYYIDFAASRHLEYIIIDEGWSDDWNLNLVNPAVDLRELVAYGKQKNVGIILWSTWYALIQDIEGFCRKYAEMGIRGFKVDFLDRDDQKVLSSLYEIAGIAARNKILLDFHGVFKPQGLTRTYPNVVNFEGVRGMEYSKWSADERVPRHEVTLPFIRMLAGPLDYTPGAMRNATRGNARPSNSQPVSQGTRCHQMAIYSIYEAPLQMLADNPTIYNKEAECTDFISRVPTTFDETVALDGQVGEYVLMARKKENTWYVGAMTNWTGRDLDIDFSFLGPGKYEAEVFSDGINAGRDATDYKREIISVDAGQHRKVHLASGGGWTARIYPVH
jgi:alpha-glucosidase